MADIYTKEQRSLIMSLIPSTGNKRTELRMIELLKQAGLKGWRRHVFVRWGKGRLRVRPDFVFRHERVAVFVDGCFWHSCPRHTSRPKQNRAFWDAKFTYNKARDLEVSKALKKGGWQVVRIWQCDLTLKRSPRAIARIRKAFDRAKIVSQRAEAQCSVATLETTVESGFKRRPT